MIGQEAIQTLHRVIIPYKQPVLSLYLDVNPAKPENAGKAFVLRAREALSALGLDKSYIGDLLTKLKLEHVIPRGHVLVVFASKDFKLFQTFYIQSDLPLLTPGNGVLARWGEVYATPLLLALDERERYGLVYLDQAKWRYFEIYLDDIEELQDAIRPLDPEAWRKFTEARTGTAVGIPARGGAGKDRFDRRVAAWTYRFHKEVAHLLADTVQARGIDRLILMGSDAAVLDLEALLPKALRQKVVGRLPLPSNPAASAQEFLELARPLIRQLEREQELGLLAQIRESGLWGFEEVLEALQAGRLYVLVLPWTLDKTVYRCTESGLIAPTATIAQRLCPDEKHELELFKNVLPELALAYGVRLEFVCNEAEAQLSSEFDGLAGLKRW